MTTKNLYRVSQKSWVNVVYAAADNQQEAIEKVVAEYPDQPAHKFNVEYVSEVYV